MLLLDFLQLKGPVSLGSSTFLDTGISSQLAGLSMDLIPLGGDEGLSLRELVDLANGSSARHRIVILDSCYSGAAGSVAGMENHAAIAEGVTILTASRSDQPSLERKGHGVFTSLLINALEGAAANLTGSITPGSVYAHIDQSLGMWDQRPVFKNEHGQLRVAARSRSRNLTR